MISGDFLYGSSTRPVDNATFSYGYDRNDCSVTDRSKVSNPCFLDEELESEEDSLESLAEIEQVYKEYESGDYITFDEYLKKHRHKLNISNSL